MITEKRNWFNVYVSLTALLAAGVLVYSGIRASQNSFSWELIPLALFTVVIGSRIAINIASLKTTVSISDVFIFLTMFLFGGEIATILCAVEAYFTSRRFTNKKELHVFNSSALAVSTFFSFFISQSVFGSVTDLIKGDLGNRQIFALGLICLSFYLINTGLMSVANGLRRHQSVMRYWKETYMWVFVPFFGSISLAFFAATAIHLKGYYALFVIIPIIGIIFFSYSSQSGKLQAITDKASQAEDHLLELTESEGRFRSAFNNAPIGMALVSPEGTWLQVNDALCDILGYGQNEFLTANYRQFIYQDDLVDFLSRLGSLIQGNRNYFQREFRFIHKEGSPIWAQTSVSLLTEANESSKIILQIQDVTARRIAEEKLRHDAFYDSLTGLANRSQLIHSLEKLVNNSKADDKYNFSLAFIDLDRFKNINDSVGHTFGDRLLGLVANRLRNNLPAEYTNVIARMGSDEFIILFDKFKDQEQIVAIIEDIQKQLSICYELNGHEIYLTSSIGLVFNSMQYADSEAVLRDGDAALREAKSKKLSSYVVFDERMSANAIKRINLENDIRRAIDNNELYLVYQPIIGLEENNLAGFEALIRWQHPKLGFVSPVDFIPIAEEIGFIVEIGKFVIETACKQIRDWQEKFDINPNFNVSVNVSAKQLLQKNFVTDLLGSLDKHHVKASQLKIEITESIVVEGLETTIAMLKHLRALGIQISMDDFGTGYSSLSYLYQLPITTLKVDRSFVNNLNPMEPQNEEIVRTILVLAHNLKLDVVAEGIETEDQLEVLKSLNCNYGQGYLFAKPLTKDDAEIFIEGYFPGRTESTRLITHSGYLPKLYVN